MKIAFFGDGPWAQIALADLFRMPVTVVVVVGRCPVADSRLRAMAGDQNIPFMSPRNINAQDFLQELRSLGADLNVSMSYDQIFRSEFLSTTAPLTINCHAGLLPFYRGRNPLNWALINGEREFGITVHQVQQTVDTGDIILQRRFAVEPADDYASLLEKAHTACAETLVDAIRLIAEGKVTPWPQNGIHPVGFYCGKRCIGDEILDWSHGSERIHNFVRALVPPAPGARTTVGDSEVAVLRTELIKEAPVYIGTVGETVARTDRGCAIKTGDSTLLVSLIAQVTRDGKLADPMFPRWPIGTRLGRNLPAELARLAQKLRSLELEIGRR